MDRPICKTCGQNPVRLSHSRGKIYFCSECQQCVYKKDKRYTGEGSGGKQKLIKYRKLVSERFKGINNPNWKGGIIRHRRGANKQLWISQIFIKDNYTCNKCLHRGGNIVAHHILPYAYFSTLRDNVDNGITLCNNCHTEYHKLFGYDNQSILQPYILFLWLQNFIKKAA